MLGAPSAFAAARADDPSTAIDQNSAAPPPPTAPAAATAPPVAVAPVPPATAVQPAAAVADSATPKADEKGDDKEDGDKSGDKRRYHVGEDSDDADSDRPLWTGTTRMASRYYEVGFNLGAGGLLHAPGAESVGLTGVTVYEHHGLISKVAIALLVALGQSDRKFVGSTTTREGNFIVTRNYYRSLTPEEQEAQREAVRSAISGNYTTSLTVYGRGLLGLNPGVTQGSGAEFSLGMDTHLGQIGQLPAVLTIGVYLASISSPVQWKAPGSKINELTYTNLGVMARLHFPVTRFADAVLEWDLNALHFFKSSDTIVNEGKIYTSPVRLGMYGNLTDRAYLKGQLTFGGLGFSDGKLGYQLEAGVRF